MVSLARLVRTSSCGKEEEVGSMGAGHEVLSARHGGQLPYREGLYEAPKPPVMGSTRAFQLTFRILICVGSVERM